MRSDSHFIYLIPLESQGAHLNWTFRLHIRFCRASRNETNIQNDSGYLSCRISNAGASRFRTGDVVNRGRRSDRRSIHITVKHLMRGLVSKRI